MKIQPYDCLGRYRVESEVGRGAMGVVYRARDPKIERDVAIKTISLAGQDSGEELEYRERFLQEARAAGRLSHPGIVAIFDASEDPTTREPFLVMEYVRGEALSKILRAAGGKLPAHDALRFSLEIAEALAYAHSHGVIHGDIKPANVLITDDGHAKIADFGVARFNHGLVTNTGKIFGSPAYMAPEQLSGGPPDARSDLFSLGVMLYSMLTGFRPFQGNSAETVCFKVMNVEPVPVTSFQAELQPGLDRIVSRAIAKDPRDRFQSGSEMADEIQAFVQNSSSNDDDTGGVAVRSTSRMVVPKRESLGAQISRAFMWQSALIVVLTAGMLAAWQSLKVVRQAEAVAPPAAAIAQAPAVHKSVEKASLRRVSRAITRAPDLARAVAPTPDPVTVENAKVRVEILHHFSAGKASVWIDDRLVIDQDLHGDVERHPVFRALEINQIANVEFAPGKHTLQVRVVAPSSDYDQTEKIDVDFSVGAPRALLVNCDKKKIQVELR
ncbi:MAG TPA: serine/threonine-protein kinase [Terriglobales bacterium]